MTVSRGPRPWTVPNLTLLCSVMFHLEAQVLQHFFPCNRKRTQRRLAQMSPCAAFHYAPDHPHSLRKHRPSSPHRALTTMLGCVDGFSTPEEGREWASHHPKQHRTRESTANWGPPLCLSPAPPPPARGACPDHHRP